MDKLTKRQESIREALGLDPRRISPKGWYITDCPYCGRTKKFGIKFTNKFLFSFNCFKCQEHGTGAVLLRRLGLERLLEGYQEDLSKIDNPFATSNEEAAEVKEVKERHPPLGWRRVMEDSYLNGRNFASWQYEKYKVGRTRLFGLLKNYVIFLIEEQGKNKGYIARLAVDPETLPKNIEPLRYINEGGVDFGLLVFGLDEILPTTQNLIFVEGITDKFNVERLLLEANIANTVAVCTFGKKLSPDQITKVRNKAVGVTKVTIIFDPDAVEALKTAGCKIEADWRSVEITVNVHSIKDPGEFNLIDFIQVYSNAQPPTFFAQNTLGVRKLAR